jgi:transcriptional regulator with XRE-family HTH domain
MKDITKDGSVVSYLGLKLQEVAALLGVAPQTISSYPNESEFFEKSQRVNKLYKALVTIGSDRYLLSAKKLAEYSREKGIQIQDESAFLKSLPARDIYNNSSEIWFFSDNPTKIIDWEEFRSSVFTESSVKKNENKRVFSFFFRTIDGATKFSELLEREAFSVLIDNNNKILYEPGCTGLFYNVYLYNIVTNLFPYGEDFIITNPGSSCIIGQPMQPENFFWDGATYRKSAGLSLSIIDEIRKLGIGVNHAPENFFPRGVILKRNIFFQDSPFTDQLVGIKGESTGGIIDKSGTLLDKYTDDARLINKDFSKKTEFTPVAILVLKRLVGSSFNSYKNRIYNTISSEFGDNKGKSGNQSESEQFW